MLISGWSSDVCSSDLPWPHRCGLVGSSCTPAFWFSRGWSPAGCAPRCRYGIDGRSVNRFWPCPKIFLPFPSIVAASRNDPFIDFGRAHTLAKFWGAHCADAGEVGHINAQSHLGEWEYGQYLLNQLIAIVSDSQPQHPRQSIDSMARARSVEDKVVRFPGTDL